MALALQTFSTVKDANAALKSAGTRYLGGGTLVVRAANEGDVSISGFVRSTEPSLSTIAVSGSKVRIGASVTMAAVARIRSSLRPPAPRGLSAVLPSATWLPSAAICLRRRPMAISPSRCWRWTQPSTQMMARCRSKPSCKAREQPRHCHLGRLHSSGGRRPSLPESVEGQAERRLCAEHRRGARTGAGRNRISGADCARLHG